MLYKVVNEMPTFCIELVLTVDIDPNDLWHNSLSELVDISDADVQDITEH